MSLINAAVCDVAVLIGGSDLRIYTLERDRELEAELIAQEHAFWSLVEERIPPPPRSTADAVRRWGRLSRPGEVVASEADIANVDKLRRARDRRADIEADEEDARTSLMSRLGDDGDTLVDLSGRPLVSWRLDRGRKSYLVPEKAPSRRFLLKA
jgi:predicted phage-related endonuclease